MATYVFQSFKLAHMYFTLKTSPPALNCMSDCSRRTTNTPKKRSVQNSTARVVRTSVRSSSERNFAESGKSETIQNDAIAHKTVKRPSSMKIHACDVSSTVSLPAAAGRASDGLIYPAWFAANPIHVLYGGC